MSSPIALGFMFPFYDQFFDSMRICSNGFISFTSLSTAPNWGSLPGSSAPKNLVAPFWTDLDSNFGGAIYYQVSPNRAIVQCDDMVFHRSPDQGPYTFQVIMEASGTITYLYKIRTPRA